MSVPDYEISSHCSRLLEQEVSPEVAEKGGGASWKCNMAGRKHIQTAWSQSFDYEVIKLPKHLVVMESQFHRIDLF
jgi:hypothetical protein